MGIMITYQGYDNPVYSTHKNLGMHIHGKIRYLTEGGSTYLSKLLSFGPNQRDLIPYLGLTAVTEAFHPLLPVLLSLNIQSAGSVSHDFCVLNKHLMATHSCSSRPWEFGVKDSRRL